LVPRSRVALTTRLIAVRVNGTTIPPTQDRIRIYCTKTKDKIARKRHKIASDDGVQSKGVKTIIQPIRHLASAT
jgi:hypothetical protein